MSDVSAAGYLHLIVHLVNGSRKQFVQSDPAAAQGILQQLRPERLFAQKQLVISSDDSVTIIPLENIERIDLRTEPLPEWSHSTPVIAVEEIGEADFLRIQRREPPPPPPVVMGRAMPQKPPAQVGVLVELRSGATTYLSVRPDQQEAARPEFATPEDTGVFLQRLFTRPVLFGSLEDEHGIFLLNPANAVRFTLTPPPPEPSAGAWPMQMVLP